MIFASRKKDVWASKMMVMVKGRSRVVPASDSDSANRIWGCVYRSVWLRFGVPTRNMLYDSIPSSAPVF